MPRRTNLLQKLVKTLQEVAASDAVVTESEMVPDSSTGKPTEVDVTIRKRIAQYDLLVCIEVNGEARKATVEWVREMKGKHDSLPTDKLVLVAKSGFVDAALECCQFHGIIALSLVDAEKDWARKLVGESGWIWLQLINLIPRAVFCIARTSDNKVFNRDAEPTVLVFSRDRDQGEELGPIVRDLLNSEEIGAMQLSRLTADDQSFWFRWEPPPGQRILADIESGKREFATLLYVDIIGEVVQNRATFRVESGCIGSQDLVWGRFKVRDENKLFVLTEDLEGKVVPSVVDLPSMSDVSNSAQGKQGHCGSAANSRAMS